MNQFSKGNIFLDTPFGESLGLHTLTKILDRYVIEHKHGFPNGTVMYMVLFLFRII